MKAFSLGKRRGREKENAMLHDELTDQRKIITPDNIPFSTLPHDISESTKTEKPIEG